MLHLRQMSPSSMSEEVMDTDSIPCGPGYRTWQYLLSTNIGNEIDRTRCTKYILITERIEMHFLWEGICMDNLKFWHPSLNIYLLLWFILYFDGQIIVFLPRDIVWLNALDYVVCERGDVLKCIALWSHSKTSEIFSLILV